MKKIVAVLCLCPLLLQAQTNSLESSPLPSGGSWSEFDVFRAGMIAGFVVGASGFIARLLRQAGRQNPEM